MHIGELQKYIDRLVISMPGAATADEQDLVKYCLSRAGWKKPDKYVVVDDTWAGLVAGTLSYSGTCVFAGTGASIYVNSEEEDLVSTFKA